MKHFTQLYGFLFLLLLLFISNNVGAYSLRQFSGKNGLSNSAILSMCQDKNGFVWFGSCDGLNMFDGLDFRVYKPTKSSNNLSGNLIETIFEAEENILWVQTNYGLDRFDSRQRILHTFKEFKGKNKLIQDRHHHVYVVKEDNYLYYYEPSDEKFYRLFVEGLIFEDILEMAMDKDDTLWIFLSNGNHLSYSVHRNGKEVSLTPKNYFKHEESVLWCFYEDDVFYFADSEYGLYEYDALTKSKYYIYDIHPEVVKHGEVSSIIKHRNDYFIGFKSNGLIRLVNVPDRKNRFSIQELDIKSGIFCLMKDKFQDIVWVGTDGQGVYMYYIDSYSIKTTLFRDLNHPLNNPVRALHLDKEHTLWIGTKGDGIVRMHHYDMAKNTCSKSDLLLTSNSLLKDNSVYSFTPSKRNVLWIGSENGINYYSYRDRQIKNLNVTADDKPVKFVHSICEFNDSTLWIATVGEGFVKVHVSGGADDPVVSAGKRFVFADGKRSSNYFFTAFKENDSIVWFGNRGYGAYRMNTLTEEIEIVNFDRDDTNQTLNDIFSIIKNDKGYWFGTSYGLAHIHDEEQRFFNESNGFPNNTIHGILQDHYNNLWLSTNRGVVKFNILQNTFQTYRQQNELDVTEFSDGASYKDEETGVMFLGGINGFITITRNEFSQREYIPPIQFNQLFIFGREYNIYDFLLPYRGKEVLELKHNRNFFSVSFTAVDYVNGNDYTYLYKLNELSEHWIENGFSNRAAFTDISPGQYTLQVKYRNNITGKESPVHSLAIRILPPWYRTNTAYFIYSLIFGLFLYAGGRVSMKWYTMKQNNMIEKLNQQRREEVHESKLRFFTNITHELCTPLTLIYGPCEKIISYKNSDGYIHKYATLILHNAEKLNGLIQELIEFRRLETGHKLLDIRRISISELTRNIAESFTELAETKGFDYQIDIADDVMWNSDSSCLNKVITNLISNAFKYTPERGRVEIKVFVENERLKISVSNTGKGIKEEDISKMFDRYTILDNIEIQSKKGSSPRNGLGLAICNSMVKLLEGEIQVTSVPGEVTVFNVLLPARDVMEVKDDERMPGDNVIRNDDFSVSNLETLPIPLEHVLPERDKSKHTIMIIDDDPSMLWFVTEMFAEKYNVIPMNDPKEVLDRLKREQPDLIISDVMMPGIDGISLTKSIKSIKLLSHIPLVLLSAKNEAEEQVRGIDSGAEVYITKPFNVEYFERIVGRLIQRKEDLKKYYGSVISTFELSDGRFTHVEDKEFFDKMLQEIEAAISNPDLTVEIVSASMGCSTRQLYRKLKNVTDKSPNDIIKEYRLEVVERLLVTTNLSVDEILYKAGFVNRGNFFKIFSRKYGMTPKSYREEKKNKFKDEMKAK